MQFQADVLGVPVVVPEVSETTALGAAYLAGVGIAQMDARPGAVRLARARALRAAMSDDQRDARWPAARGASRTRRAVGVADGLDGCNRRANGVG